MCSHLCSRFGICIGVQDADAARQRSKRSETLHLSTGSCGLASFNTGCCSGTVGAIHQALAENVAHLGGQSISSSPPKATHSTLRCLCRFRGDLEVHILRSLTPKRSLVRIQSCLPFFSITSSPPEWSTVEISPAKLLLFTCTTRDQMLIVSFSSLHIILTGPFCVLD